MTFTDKLTNISSWAKDPRSSMAKQSAAEMKANQAKQLGMDVQDYEDFDKHMGTGFMGYGKNWGVGSGGEGGGEGDGGMGGGRGGETEGESDPSGGMGGY